MLTLSKEKRLEKRFNRIKERDIPKHIGIILDGNGRWAKKRGLPRIMGHAQGIKRIEMLIPEVKRLGVKVLTIFTFSTENWNRPNEEVNFIMNEAQKIYEKMINNVSKLGYNVRVIGEQPLNHPELIEKIKKLNDLGNNNEDFTLCIAFNYGSQKEIINATKKLCQLVKNDVLDIEDINEDSFEKELYTNDLPPVDLLIRTSGEMRISNFLLWQISYAEMYFPKVYWPDFDRTKLYDALEEYQKRSRRFGKIGESNA